MNRCISAGIVLVLLAVACSPGTAQVTWTRYGTTPVLQPTYDPYCGFDYSRVVEPYVMKEGQVYRMWYFGNTGIGDALSLDGAHWYKNTANPVLTAGRGPTVVHDHSGYKMYYFTFDEWTRVINLATSEDGNSWTPYPGNPVISW